MNYQRKSIATIGELLQSNSLSWNLGINKVFTVLLKFNIYWVNKETAYDHLIDGKKFSVSNEGMKEAMKINARTVERILY